MIEKFFEGSSFYNFPSFEVALFSLLLAFVLSGMIAFTYFITFRGEQFPNTFFQAMVLSSVVTAMIMMAVGNNLAVGFGIIGAVAIIRFRTHIQDPRNIIFMFAGISVGIAMGVYGYAIGIAGTVIFCITAFLLHFSNFGTKHKTVYEVIFWYEDEVPEIESILSEVCEDFNFSARKRNEEGTNRIEYLISLKEGEDHNSLYDRLVQPGIFKEVRVSKRKSGNQL
ncbi:MAG: DUF4956 domain-containing protein [Cyclobacteriaceae bacterium]